MQERDSAEKGDQPEEAPTVRGPMPGIPVAPVPGKRVVVWVQDEEMPSQKSDGLRRVPSGVAPAARQATEARS